MPAAPAVRDGVRVIDFRVPLQLGLVWLVTALCGAAVGWLVLLGFFLGSAPLVVIGMLGPFAALYAVGTATAKASPLTTGAGRRVGWAALVTVYGLVGAVFFGEALEASGPARRPSWVGITGLGLVFTLVAAILSHGLVVRLVAAAVTVAAVAFGVWWPTTMPADDAASRIAHAGLPGGVLLIATPDGYEFPRLTVGEDRATLDYSPSGPVGDLHASPRLIVRPATVRTTELVRLPDTVDHVVVRRIGEVEAVAVVSDSADVAAVRAFALSVRPATDDEVERLLPPAPDRRDRDVPARFARAWGRLF
ncbi:MAG: hypothetical protein HOV94_39760 [Saccharothrix sp.]|nr:hypothetical protein [Saccharothrix sp.]